MQSSFKQKVYELTNKIPKGSVATYGQLARLVGRPKASRAVGMCMRTNPNAPVTPCHRVVSSDGSLTGYSGGDGLATKLKMLQSEGVVFKGSRVDLQKSLWVPKL